MSLSQFNGFIVACVCFLSVGCLGSARSVEPILAPYVREFESLYWLYFPGDIKYVAIPPESNKTILGRCIIRNNKPSIIINKSYPFTKEQLRITIYHELGHCVANLKHNNELMSDGCPVSIMHQHGDVVYRCFSLKRSYYLKQLESAIYK